MNNNLKFTLVLGLLAGQSLLLAYHWSTITNALSALYTLDQGAIYTQQQYKGTLFLFNAVVIVLLGYSAFKQQAQLSSIVKFSFLLLFIAWSLYCFMHIVAVGIVF